MANQTHRSPWPRRDAHLRRLIAAGLRSSEIAAEMGLCTDTITRRRQALGISDPAYQRKSSSVRAPISTSP